MANQGVVGDPMKTQFQMNEDFNVFQLVRNIETIPYQKPNRFGALIKTA